MTEVEVVEGEVVDVEGEGEVEVEGEEEEEGEVEEVVCCNPFI